jgi:hypothetical protein
MGLVRTGEAPPVLTQKHYRSRWNTKAGRGNSRNALERRRKSTVEAMCTLGTGT